MNRELFTPRPPRPKWEDCAFYHTMAIPGHGVVHGAWDLRAGVDAYLGGVDFNGATVLEIGPASGFLTFEMERRGAEVTACDIAPNVHEWDIVPYADRDLQAVIDAEKGGFRRLNNAFWLGHYTYGSKARHVSCRVYDIPVDLGSFDIAMLGMVLLHLRDPFGALQVVTRHTTNTVIVTDILPFPELPIEVQSLDCSVVGADKLAALSSVLEQTFSLSSPKMHFCPKHEHAVPTDTWWLLTPSVIEEFLGVLGFRDQSVTYHWQIFDPAFKENKEPRPVYFPCFTVVARR